MNQCYKVFRRIENQLWSVYNVYPLKYAKGKKTYAPNGLNLFVYELAEQIGEKSPDREIWLCECSTIHKKEYHLGFRNECFWTKDKIFGYKYKEMIDFVKLHETYIRKQDYLTTESSVTKWVIPIKNVTNKFYLHR